MTSNPVMVTGSSTDSSASLFFVTLSSAVRRIIIALLNKNSMVTEPLKLQRALQFTKAALLERYDLLRHHDIKEAALI